MERMFAGATSFNNGDPGNNRANPLNWADTSKVTNMQAMFNAANAFNQAIGTWNTGAVTHMAAMFDGANAFNQDISNWNTGAVTDMGYMFKNAWAFNQVINTWTASPSSCTIFAYGATAWNTAYPGGINANPPLSPSMVAAGCGL